MAIVDYNVNNITKGVNGFGLKPSNSKYSVTLGAASEKTLTVPSQAMMGGALFNVNKFNVVFYASARVFLAINATAEVPAGASFAATTSEMIPANVPFCRLLNSGDVIHVITSQAATDLSVVFYYIPE